MGKYQIYRGNPENKLFYLVDQLVGGLNTDFSDDTSPDNEFSSLVNFNMDKRGSLYKRKGFGELDALSQIFNKFNRLPDVKLRTPEDPNSAAENDSIVYMKLLQNDNNCFRNLSAFSGTDAYKKYQELYGFQTNKWKLLIVTTNMYNKVSTAWLYECTLGPLPDDVQFSEKNFILPVLFNWERNLTNMETIEYFDKIYFTGNDTGLVVFDRKTDEFSYNGKSVNVTRSIVNGAYKPNAMEIRKVGFNVLGDDPLHFIDFQGLTTDSIQGVFLTTDTNLPIQVVPSGGTFRLNVLYTGTSDEFTIGFKEGGTELSFDSVINDELSVAGLKVYDIKIKNVPTTEVEIQIEKNGTELDPYYDFYPVGSVDSEIKPIESLNVGSHGLLEMYNRAVYYKYDTIWFSEINTFNYVPNYNYVSLPIEPTDRITRIVFFRNVYVIFTKHRIYKMIGAFGTTDFEIMPVNLSIGCHAPNTVVPVENELYFASPRGIYALKSSDFLDGIENLKELDTKVKKVTSDSTLYLSEQNDPAIRYNGISEYAHSIRYKEKYMTFFNTDPIDESISDYQVVDVLVYQYDLKAFSEIKFPAKPTFLFEVDGALMTYASIPEKQEYTEEEVLLEYDFESMEHDKNPTTVLDKSGNNLHGQINDSVIKPSTSLYLDGETHYPYMMPTSVMTGIIDKQVDLAGGSGVNLYIDLKREMNFTVFNFQQSTPTALTTPQNFSITTAWKNGYRGVLVCNTVPNTDFNNTLVNYTLRWERSSTGVNGSSTGTFNLKVGSANLIATKSFSFNMGSSLTQNVSSGSFTVTHNEQGIYAQTWDLSISSKYSVTSTGWNKGPDTNLNVYQNSSFSSYFGVGIEGTATAKDGGCNISYRPYFLVKKYSHLGLGTRTMTTWVNDKEETYSITGIYPDGEKDYYYYGDWKSQSINYNSSSKSITLDASFYLNATISGTKRNYINLDEVSKTLPSVTSYNTTTWYDFTVSSSQNIVLNPISEKSYRVIKLEYFTSSKSFVFSVDSEFGDYNSPHIPIAPYHETLVGNKYISMEFSTVNNQIRWILFLNDGGIGQGDFPTNLMPNCTRDMNNIVMSGDCDVKEFSLGYGSFGDIMLYNFDDGEKSTVKDHSGNGNDGKVIGPGIWNLDPGIALNGHSSYVRIPELPSNVRFSNGFIIEFEAKQMYGRNERLLDLSVSENRKNDTSTISVDFGSENQTDSISLKSTSVDSKTYVLKSPVEDTSLRNKYKLECLDTGTNYNLITYINDVEINRAVYNYGGITNILRKYCFIGKSNNVNYSNFLGTLYNFKITIKASSTPIQVYKAGIFEYETTLDDFGRPMEIELETKGINLQYPLHSKKLKNVFIKGLGGFNYNNFFFEIYSDGHLVNDPKVYSCVVDEITKQIVYDYTEEKEFSFNEMTSLLGNMRLNNTKLGESTYQTRKMIVPTKGKNFTVKIYGESSDYLSIESLGFVFKVGKVREE